MRLFLRDHLGILILFLADMGALFVCFWAIDGFRSSYGLVYFLLLSTFLLVVTLCVRYFRRRRLYAALEHPHELLEELVASGSSDPLSSAFARRDRTSYQAYLSRLNSYRDDTEAWQSHVIQWAHQMKTPISVIRLQVQGEGRDIDGFQVLCELDRLQRQLDLMLNLARMGRFENDLVVEEVRLCELVGEVVRQNRRLFAQSEVLPQLAIGEDLVARTDRKWLSFVCDQLLHNAVKFSEPGSHVEVSAVAEGRDVRLVVRDQGCGIRPRDLPRVCELYYTGSNGREGSQSSGVGLYLVKRVLDQLGHTLAISSEQGVGTTVEIGFSS